MALIGAMALVLGVVAYGYGLLGMFGERGWCVVAGAVLVPVGLTLLVVGGGH